MIVKSTQATAKVFLGVSFDVLAVGEHTMVTRMRYEAGAHIPGHRHPNEQAGYVISGRVRVRFGEHDEILEAGDSYVIPKDLVHTFDVLEAGEVIDVFCPPREDYLA
jgi:quercetin dioxygenase-like cupin family protein